MSQKVRFGSFNVENLFGRYKFLNKPPADRAKNYTDDLQVVDVVALEPGRKGTIKPTAITEEQRRNTALAVLDAEPDILAFCEVENLSTLRIFNAKYLKNYFDRLVMVQGNDPRGINVGLALRRGFQAELGRLRTHADDSKSGGFVSSSSRLDSRRCLGEAAFSRDCFEVEVDVAGAQLTFLVNHLKAQETKNGKDPTTAKRLQQATSVAAIVSRVVAEGRQPVVLGDFNKDSASDEYDGSLEPLVAHPELVDPITALPEAERWTHFYDSEKSVSRLDYVLVDRGLEAAVQDVDIVRGGLSPSCTQYTGPRLGTVASKKGVEASDHCPIVLSLKLG